IAAQQGRNFTPFETNRESSKIFKATSEHIVRISNEKGRANNSTRCHSFGDSKAKTPDPTDRGHRRRNCRVMSVTPRAIAQRRQERPRLSASFWAETLLTVSKDLPGALPDGFSARVT